MADGYDRFDNEGGGGGSFVMGLLTGTVLGAASGCCSRRRPARSCAASSSEQAGNLANTASEGYRARRAKTAGELGREAAARCTTRRARRSSRGADEAQRYVREATSRHTAARRPAGTGSSSGSSRRQLGDRGTARGIRVGADGRDRDAGATVANVGARVGRRGGGVRGHHDAAAPAACASTPRGCGWARASPLYLRRPKPGVRGLESARPA